MHRRTWKAVKWSAGLLSLYLGRRLRKRRKYRPLDVLIIDVVMRLFLTKPHLRSFTPEERSLYEKTISKTVYWHGTGKLQHGKSSVTVNVLAPLLKQHGLRPFKDTFDVKQGEMISTSLARHRMYARIYADMHVYNGARLSGRYGSPRFWAYYFIMAVNLHAIKELGLWDHRARREQMAAWRGQGQKFWIVKVTKQIGEPNAQFFNNGSDIPGNYPILIGLKQADYHVLETAAYVARYESRIGNAIPISSFTHLEVPASKMAEVTTLLKKHGYNDLPVFSFEQCEQFHANQHFSTLVR